MRFINANEKSEICSQLFKKQDKKQDKKTGHKNVSPIQYQKQTNQESTVAKVLVFEKQWSLLKKKKLSALKSDRSEIQSNLTIN